MSIRESDKEIMQYDVQRFMASVDSIEDNTGFAEKNGARFPILSDAEKTVAKAFGVMSALGFSKRWTFYIDPKGKIALIDKKITPHTAGSDIVKNLQALEVPRNGS